MYNSDVKLKVYVISHKRPQNVPAITALIGDATWIVGYGEGRDYANAGAYAVMEGGGLIDSRNIALRDGWEYGWPTVMIEDDVKGFHLALDKKRKKEISFVEAIKHFEAAMRETRNMYYLAGCAPTNNLFYYNPMRPLSFSNFVLGSFIYVRPCDLYFDPKLRLKEDYDYTLQHIQKYGGVCRCNDLLLDVQHYSNKGGAVDYRTEELEQQTIRQLKAKWGRHVVDNPRRKNEILLKV